MEYETKHRPAYALAHIRLDTGESLQAEPGAMVSMSDSVRMTTAPRGGLFKSIRRSLMGGESFFINTFTAEGQPGDLTIAPPMPGDVEALDMSGPSLMVQSGSFLAASGNITVDSQWGGAKSFFAKEGLFLLRCSGAGHIFISSHGAIERIDLKPGQKHTVDNGHMVAFDESVRYSIGKAGGWGSSILGGEGLVCKLEGPGRFFMQTRNEDAFIQWLTPQLARSLRPLLAPHQKP